MKLIHLVTAHPYTKSFNFALRNQAIETLKQANLKVSISDLYQQKFDPLLNSTDFSMAHNQYGKLSQQQSDALVNQSFLKEITSEQNKLNSADLLILQYPIWWGSFPAILKGWVERVLSYGFAYGSQKQLANKAVMMSVTSGGASNKAEEDVYKNKLTYLAQDVFGYMGMNILESFICHGPAHKSQSQLSNELVRFSQHLNQSIQQL
ncbi:NAD(P)H-dependent oxidoreductase [Aliikangiella sp. IMCC44359]|uniref:NAD(P)H-dependent oxidoreductase n=1 Tax=Aliikangiella sp. IMCC44359 TaxID=3459125 RepID=UPI00403AC7E7